LRASLAKPPCGGLHPTAPGGFATEGRSFQLPAAPGPNALGRGHRPWVEAAQNARQLDVAGSACQAPCRGLRLTAPGGFASRRPQFPTAGRSGPHCPWPRPAPVGENRTKRPATGRCGLRLQSPLPGLRPTAPGGFATEGRSFQLPAVPRPTPPAAAIARGWKLHRTPGNWTLRAPLAKPPCGAIPNRPRRFRN